jgi:hypothetical protein
VIINKIDDRAVLGRERAQALAQHCAAMVVRPGCFGIGSGIARVRLFQVGRGVAPAPQLVERLEARNRQQPRSTQPHVLRQDLLRVRLAWEGCQSSRARHAIYNYLTAVFDLVMWWAAENRAVSRARWALKLQGVDATNADEPFAAIILATADGEKVDKRTRSKWSRVLRYAMKYKSPSEPLDKFVKRKGGINECAKRFSRCLGRGARS